MTVQTKPLATPARPMPPITRGLPLLGVLPSLIRRQFDYLLEARARYGDIYTLDLGLSSMVVLNHPHHAGHVLRDHSRNYRKGGPMWDSVRTLLGNGLVVSEGDFWMRQRRMMQPQFHRKRLAALTEMMVDAIAAELDTWRTAATSGKPFDVPQALNQVTMKVIVRTLFGTGLDSEEARRVGEDMAFVLDFMFKGIVVSALPKWLPVPGAKRYQEALRRIDAALFEVIARTRQSEEYVDNLISMLLSMVDAETGEQMTDQQLRDEALTLFLAGYETTSMALSWGYDLLVRHPEVIARLTEEVDAVLGDRLPTFADIPALAYTSRVVQESMRLRPPAWWIPRTAIEDDEIDGFKIPAGTNVAVLIYAIHRHPEHWDNPEQFDPDRFLPENAAQRDRDAWVPFGTGQRQCIGKDFAMMEAALILAMITQRYRVSSAGHVAQPRFSTTLKPAGSVFVQLARR